MKPVFYILFFFLVSCLSACDKAPDGIIKESKMEDMLLDFCKAEGLIDLRQDDYPNDSTKLVLRQSIFEKYGVTMADYDTSLVWYAHHVEIYQKVYQRVIERLQKEQKELQGDIAAHTLSAQGLVSEKGLHKVYPPKGDTANVWQDNTMWLLTPGMRQGYIKFNLKPDREMQRGDQLKLSMKLLGFNNSFNLVLATDYTDGSVSLSNRTILHTGWSEVDLQTDSSRTVRHIFGYIHYTMAPHSVAFIDSIQLLRTHLDTKQYSRIATQKFFLPATVAMKRSSGVASSTRHTTSLPQQEEDAQNQHQQWINSLRPGFRNP